MRRAVVAALTIAVLVAAPAALAKIRISLQPASARVGQTVTGKIVSCKCFGSARLFLAPAQVTRDYGEDQPVFRLDRRFVAVGKVSSAYGFAFPVPRVKPGSYRLYVECLRRDGCGGVSQFLPLSSPLTVK